ncbi:hypothetical protein QYF61_026041 [Mycteria americana]|uniref:Rna-directed dna polymerase from mobile element jockey-like n=1 Tax=Mycteria americana TaxID=33587 RepID=A0AAN7N089_MYCAM|nr:hypothetical protein QYF61_026041 [Mycteria americana]
MGHPAAGALRLLPQTKQLFCLPRAAHHSLPVWARVHGTFFPAEVSKLAWFSALSRFTHTHQYVNLLRHLHKREVDKRWEQGQGTQEKYSVAVHWCRDGVRKAKAHLELNLARDVKETREVFYTCMNSKRKMPLRPEGRSKKTDLPSVKKDQVREHINKVFVHKLRSAEGAADVTMTPLSTVFEWSWHLEEVPEDWNRANITPIFKNGKKEDLENYRPFSTTSIPRKVTNNCSRKLFPDT